MEGRDVGPLNCNKMIVSVLVTKKMATATKMATDKMTTSALKQTNDITGPVSTSNPFGSTYYCVFEQCFFQDLDKPCVSYTGSLGLTSVGLTFNNYYEALKRSQ